MNPELPALLKKMTDEDFQDAYRACKGAAPALDVALELELIRRAYQW